MYSDDEWLLVDIGYEETVDDYVEIIRQLDFPFSRCKTIIATHADVDHIQGLAKLKQLLKTTVTSHPNAVKPLEQGDKLLTLARWTRKDCIWNAASANRASSERWRRHSSWQPRSGGVVYAGHTNSQLAFRMGDVLLSGDNIYRDGCVGAIDAHHGSDIKAFIKSLIRIRDSDVKWLAPSHGPIFAKDSAMIQKTIDRLQKYLFMADFGTLADDWPLMDQWEDEVAAGSLPNGLG